MSSLLEAHVTSEQVVVEAPSLYFSTWCTLDSGTFPLGFTRVVVETLKPWSWSLLVFRKRPPEPLALFNACRWRDSCRYGCKTISKMLLREISLREKETKMYTYFPIFDEFVLCFELCTILSTSQNSMVLLCVHIYWFLTKIKRQRNPNGRHSC